MKQKKAYQTKHAIRIVTAASLFDGHDAAINIMRRIIQAGGVEVIHLGHDRSVSEIVDCAIAEDAQAIAVTSYQGGHNEFFTYMYDLLLERDPVVIPLSTVTSRFSGEEGVSSSRVKSRHLWPTVLPGYIRPMMGAKWAFRE